MGRHICLVLSLVLTGLSIDEYFSFSNSTGAASLSTDALGSTLALTDSTGAVFSTSVYEPFGWSPRHRPQSEQSAHHYPLRVHRPRRRRRHRLLLPRPLLQHLPPALPLPDPLDLPGIDSSLYTYVDNDPVSAIDHQAGPRSISTRPIKF